MLNAAEAAGFQLLITADKNIQYQQNLSTRKIALIVLGHAQWPTLRHYTDRVIAAVNTAQPGDCRTYCLRDDQA